LRPSNSKIRVIGTRHGEKLYETLIAREEMNRAKDLGKYFCISADNRDLNYKKYFTEGKKEISGHNDYTSHNTTKLSRKELKKLLRYYVERQARDEYA
jgi:UDP-N-acetylglucosamine 4,6-dehydratase